jgi:DNA-binding NarL/FixJ family response regulator
MIRILLVDDHTTSREALAYLLDREPDLSVVGQADSVASAMEQLQSIDAAIIDLKLPDGSGIDIVRRLRELNPRASILCLTASENEADLALAVEAGAGGVLHKSATTQQLVHAIRQLSAGLPVHSTDEVIRLFRIAAERRYQDQSNQEAARLIKELTSRELEVLHALAWGLSDKEIAFQLGISARTARSHMANILSKLHVESRLQAVILAIRTGVVSADPLGRPPDQGSSGNMSW